MKNLYGPAHSQPSESGRPVGVMLIAILCFIGAVIVIVYGTQALLVLRDPGSAEDAASARALLPIAIGLLPLLLALGTGLWRLRNWARYLSVGFLALGIVLVFVDAFLRYSLTTGVSLAVTRSLVPTAMIIYLLHPMTAAAFRAKPTA